ncbi:MAG: MerR family transcriptional regulator [Pseudomonadota bacterium]
MSETETISMPIGAVTQLTGISSHTLRKWETRYAAVEPVRTETGRRLYTQVQVQRLSLLRDLIRQGHQISQLAAMSDEDLEGLRQAPPVEQTQRSYEAAVVVGPVLSAVLRKKNVAGLQFESEAGAAWLTKTAAKSAPRERGEALAVELPTITEADVQSLITVRREHFDHVVVVYGFANRKSLRRLLDSGLLCLKAPVGAEELLQSLAVVVEGRTVLANLEAVPAHRFSQASIARLAALSPKLQCECPNHIAQLLLDISAFEQYSMECEDTDPAERALHARLRLIAANARSLFEEAMAEVAENEGLELEEL